MEVPYVGSDLVRWTPVKVPSSSQSAASSSEEPCCPPPRNLAGTVCFGPPSFRRVIWRVHQSSPSTLELIELDDNEVYMSGLQLLFTEPLSPFIALCPVQVKGEEDTLSLYTITMSGAICICKIRRFYMYRKSSTLAKSDLFQLSLAGNLAKLDKVTAFAAFGGCFCVGGKSGTILCYPFEQISGDVKDLCYELKDNDARLARLWGLVARTKTSSPVQCLSMQHLQETSVLFSLHEDLMFRLWDLSDRSRLLSFNLLKSDLSGFTPKGMWVQEHGPRTGPWKVAFLFQSTQEIQMDIVHIYELQWRLLDSGANPSTITFLSKATSTQGRVLDMKLLSDSFWTLEDANGNYVLTHGTIEGEGCPELCELFDMELEDQLFQQCGDDWEDLVLFQQSTMSNAKIVLQFPMSDMLLSRILQPGVYQHELLRKVLENRKRKLSEQDRLTLTMDGIRKEILAAVEGESIGSSIFKRVSEWKSFLGDYVMLWKQYNMPYSLLFDSYSGSVGLIRRQTLSIIRSLSPFEKLYRGGSVAKSLDGSNSDTNNCHRDVFHLLSSCTKTVARPLGRVPLSAFSEVILRKKPALLSHVSSVFLQLLSAGYDHSVLTTGTSHFGVDIARRKKMDYHQKQRKFELQISLDLQQLEETVGSWEGVLHAIDKYTDHLVDDMHVSVSRHSFEGPVYGAMNKRLVSKAMAQISWTYFEAARDLLLFLGYTFKLKGQAGMVHGEVSKLQRKLTEKIQNVLLLNLLVHWLSVTFGKLTPSEDFNLHLSSLRLDSVSSDRSQNRYIEMSLSEILLSASSQDLSKGLFLRMKGLINSEALLYNAQSFISWIVLGENEDLQGSFSSRSVALAIALLQHGQFHALEDYLYLVESICNGTEMRRSSLSIRGEWCANLHLMGCALIGQYRNNVKDSDTVMKVEKAAHCFFCVASAAEKDREDLQNLLQSTGMQTSFSSLTSAASWKLQYFEWVMQIFEQNNVSKGACQFAHAALQEVDEAVKDLNVDAPEMTSAAVMIKGRLWANIFKFCLDLSHYRDAYCAIVSNPDDESKYICLRRFLIVLCEQKATGVLCGFELPYAGMLERVEQELVLKAKYCDITANPNPYKLLYSFHIERNNYRRASLYMYLYSLRLREISLSKDQLPLPFLLQEQLYALATALNALSLVHPSSAWLDAESYASGSISQRTSTKRLRVYAETDEQASQRCQFVDLTKLEMDYTLVSAELLLVEMKVELNLQGGDLSPADVLRLLVQSGLYEMAFTVLFRFWKGSSLKSELECIFRIMAEKWCSTGRPSETTRDFMSSEKSLVLSSSFLEPEDENKPAYRLSELNIPQDTANSVKSNFLQKYLELYAKLHTRLPAVVAEAMLTVDRLMELPVWLVDMMKGGRQAGSQGMSAPNADPAALVRIYLDFGRVSEAAILLLDYFKAWANQRPVDIIKRKRMCAVWFPYTLVDRVRVQLREQNKSKQLEALESLLNNGLVHHLKQLETDSSDVKSMV